jgi:hypothetical protein
MKLPVRLSVHDQDIDWHLAHRLIIKVDGVEQAKVVSFDTEAGTVTRLMLNDAGEIMVDQEAEEPMTETVTGTVTVDLRHEAPDPEDTADHSGPTPQS